MSMIEEPTSAPKPAKPAKRRKRAKAVARPAVEKVAATVDPNDEMGGLSSTECPFDCSADRCVISGLNVCGHPNKGGLQAAMMNNPEAMKRYNRARKILAVAAANKRA